jgi:SEC-C motif-containing protein
MSMTSYTPSELIMARTDAFACGDFGFIYDSYHPESNFRRQFPDRGEYCRYGVESLSPDYKIIDCRVNHVSFS